MHVKSMHRLIDILEDMKREYIYFKNLPSNTNEEKKRYHGYINLESFILHFPSYKVILIPPIEDLTD
jgi:hypothetical protein